MGRDWVQRLALLPIVMIVLTSARESPAQEAPIDGGTAENYPYTQDLGVGGYDAGQQEVVNVKIPVSRLLRSPEEYRWGVRLRFPISFGVFGLSFGDFLGDLDPERVQTLTFVPAAEFLIPLSERWLLKPRQDFGIGKDFSGGDWIWITATEVQGVYTRPWKNLVFTFGSGVKYSFSQSANDLYDDDFGLVKVGFDTLIPFGLNIGKRRVDFSLYTLVRHYFRELVFDQVLSEPLVIDQEYEIGITLGSTPLPRIWKFNVPRFLIGYRFGENLRGIRLKFGLPF